MILLYPQKMKKNHEIKVVPNNSYLLLYGIRINSKIKGKFNIKWLFKTMKYKIFLKLKRTQNLYQ